MRNIDTNNYIQNKCQTQSLLSPLLTRCVPDLKFNFLSSKLNGFDFEVNADSGNEGGVEGILWESANTNNKYQYTLTLLLLIPEENACFPHPRVPDKQEFEEKIIGLLGHGSAGVVRSLITVHWVLVSVTSGSVSPGETASHIRMLYFAHYWVTLAHCCRWVSLESRLGCALCSETKIRFWVNSCNKQTDLCG